ncbi:sodium-dependent transporter, partial [Pseudoalteromonas sp. SIMBA_148]
RGQKNPVNTFADVAASEGKSSSWSIVGATGILGGFLILSFYSVIGCWALNYIAKVSTGSFVGQDSDSVAATFDAMLASAGTLTIWHTVFMILTA